MRINVRRSGGIAGARVGGAVETEELPPELRERIDQILRAERLAGAAERSAPPSPGAADLFQYDVNTPEGSWSLSDATPDTELVQALDDLVAEIVRRRRGDSQAG